ncbi:peptidase E [Ichthyenterobacterium sp. W332]|uniref:Peptidase E n=1 Tax=Microcosmobacter mediterraneus TaxID=3075607 RepID=A0ABU2YJJ9_9FLAO|nr:DUF6702 family protein [Ichthyenterobacterium sp. W332]MDT0558349.1 peptidase E [Ichthyenterobacterium sp. W332]
MKNIKYLLVAIVCFSLISFTSAHKYYVSVTQIEYVEDKSSLQIISRIFIDDFERILQERYDDSIILGDEEETDNAIKYIEQYLKTKLSLRVNDQDVNFNFIGKKYDNDIVICYLEVENIKQLKTFEISNKVLFELYEEQQNIVRTKIYSKRKSLILIAQNDKGMLKF